MNNPDESSRPAEADARAALRRLAAHANSEPTRPLGTYEMATEPAGSGTGERFEWRRLAVAAAIVALVGGGVVALNLRSGDSSIGSAPVDPIATSSPQGDVASDPSLGAGFGPVFRETIGQYELYQHQYAESAERPETGRYLTVTDLPGPFEETLVNWGDDFYLTVENGAETAPPITTLVPDTVGTAPDTLAVVDTVADCPSEGPMAVETTVAADVSNDGISADGVPCRALVTIMEVDGNSVAVSSMGLSEAEIEAAVANIIPSPDGFGHVVNPVALPNGLFEIAVGSITHMFEPLEAEREPASVVDLVWTPGSAAANPVLDSSGVDQAWITAVGNRVEGLPGQRLLNAEVRDSTVGDFPAVVQIAPSGAVRVVWHGDGMLFMYEEVGSGADADATVQRANELWPFIVGELADDVDSVDSPTTTTLPSGCYNGYPTTVQEERGGTTVPLAKCLGIPESTAGDVTLPAPTTEPTSGPTSGPTTTEPDHHTPTTEQGVPTTATLPRPPFDGTSPSETTTIPDWPSQVPTTEEPPYPGPSDTSGTTTTYLDYEPSPTTMYPASPSTVPYPGP